MEPEKDFKELLALFDERKVEYLVVGAYALAHHGAPRFTGDLDLLVKPDAENALRVLEALDAFGFGSVDITVDDLTSQDSVVQLGYPPVRIDLMTSISGVSWEEAESGAEMSSFGGQRTRYLGRAELIRNKRSSGRAKDAADLEALGEE